MKKLRSKFKYDDERTNIGHIVATEHNNYPLGTSIKLVVHPLMTENTTTHSLAEVSTNENSTETNETMNDSSSYNTLKGQIEGYGPPVNFTCDSK